LRLGQDLKWVSGLCLIDPLRGPLWLLAVALMVEAAAIVKKESHPVLVRQKREWIWNSLYVEEEKPAPIPYKIGQVSLRTSNAPRLPKKTPESHIFTVDHKGDLFVTTSLDREEKSSYHLTARMFDGNNKLIEDYGDFVVQVTDINDNLPVFPRTYNGSIMERSSIGKMMFRCLDGSS
uniref:Cadherin domain-containing protein n=1 Tax=Acanthochromis polyacanthus TaxID=80966 RepID=A0A3Q1FDZ3_9TELE